MGSLQGRERESQSVRPIRRTAEEPHVQSSWFSQNKDSMSWARHGLHARGAGTAAHTAFLLHGGPNKGLTATRGMCSAVDNKFSGDVEQQAQNVGNDEKEIDDALDHDHGFPPLPPWQALLEPVARAKWRSSAQGPPPYLGEEHFTILQETQRTSKQLRQTHKQIVQAHTALAERRERERRRAVNPKVASDSLLHKEELHRDSQVNPVYYGPSQTLANLKHRLLPNYAIVKRVLMETQSLLMGDPSFQPRRIIDFGIGCGSASAAAMDVFDTLEWIHGIDPSRSMRDGADHVLQTVSGQKSTPPPRVTLSESLSTEKTRGSFDIAICAYTAVELPHTASMLTAAAVLWEKLRPNGVLVMIEPGTPDGFNSCHAVREMLLKCCPPTNSETPGEEQCHVLAPCTHSGRCPMERHQRNFKRKDGKGAEGAKEMEFSELESDRIDSSFSDDDYRSSWDDSDDDDSDDEIDVNDMFNVESLDETTEPTDPVAETHAFDRAFCSFVHTFPGGSRRSSGEKFSYVVVQKRTAEGDGTTMPAIDREHNHHHPNLTELLSETYKAGKSRRKDSKVKRHARDRETHLKLLEEAQTLQAREASVADVLGLDFLHGDANRNSFGRIIRAPLKKRGHILVDYCSATLGQGDGRIVRHRVSKGWSARVAPGMYSAARKARWGGFWPDIKERILETEQEPQKEEDPT